MYKKLFVESMINTHERKITIVFTIFEKCMVEIVVYFENFWTDSKMILKKYIFFKQIFCIHLIIVGKLPSSL